MGNLVGGTRKRILSVTKDDCVMQTFRAGGNGGQNQNARDSGVRFIHPPSGARGEARDERSQGQNKKLAWRRMVESVKFQTWLKIQLGQQMLVESQITDVSVLPEDIKIEVKRAGRWARVLEHELNG